MQHILNEEAFLTEARDARYGKKYFDNYKERSYTEIGWRLNTFRRAYVESFSNEGEILDFGTGYGDLVMKDASGRWFGFDINSRTKDRLGHRFDDNWQKYPNICLFDVLEHLERPDHYLSQIHPGVRLFVSIPLWPGNWNNLNSIHNWKHWKDEHVLYASRNGFETLMDDVGFKQLDRNVIETSLGREDIYTFVFEKC